MSVLPESTLPFESLVVATSNRGKLAQLERLLCPLEIALQSLSDYSSIVPVVEDGKTIESNARLKATGYAIQTQRWVIADDTGLEVDVLDGAPGVETARYAGEGASPKQRREKLLSELKRFQPETWSARFVCVLAIASPDGQICFQSHGRCEGRIIQTEAGEFGLGYDRIFQLAEYHRRLAELAPAASDVISHRGRAAHSLLRQLRFRRSENQP